MERTPIGNLEGLVDQDVKISGWVDTVRNLKRMQFVLVRDSTGMIQGMHEKKGDILEQAIVDLKPESTVDVYGKVVYNPNVKLSPWELVLKDIEVTSAPLEAIPIDESSGIDARLDYRWVDLRQPKNLLVFQIQTTAEHAMRSYWINHGFTEIHSPKLVAGATESGAELFSLDYFGQVASLAQSPQFYKQMAMAAGMDRVFEIGPVFRANSSHTKRHDTEFTSVDMEMANIRSHDDIMEFEQGWLQYVLSAVKEKHDSQIKKYFNVDVVVPTLPFPRITLDQAHQILEVQGYRSDRAATKGDLDPEGERRVAEHIREQFGHEFVFVTDYPISVRPFYHMRHSDNPKLTKSFDLLWKGLELTTGAQREHRHPQLHAQALEKGVDPIAVRDYLNFFKYGCPPHGGFGFGLSRMLMNLVEAPSVKEVTYLYRGPSRLTP